MNLSELIDTHKGRRSYPELSRDCGGAPTSKRLQQLVREPIKNFPDPPTVAAMARGLKVPQRVVVLAAAESLGLDVRDVAPRITQLLPVTAGNLSEEQAASIAHLVDLIVSDPRLIVEPDEPEEGDPIEPTVIGALAARAELSRRRQLEDQGLDDEAARDTGKTGARRVVKDKQDAAGEPLADDSDDMEPR